MSSKSSNELTLKEKIEIGGKKALASTLIAIGAIGLAGCGDKVGAEPKPAATQSQAAEVPVVEETPVAPENPESSVPKIRENWVVNEAALENLGRILESPGLGDLNTVRGEVCGEFLANNPLDSDFGTPSRTDKVEVVEARFEAKQQLFRAYMSDVLRDSDLKISDSYKLSGAESCLTNGVTVQGTDTMESLRAIEDDKPLPSITTSPKEYSFKDPSEGFVRTSYVTVSVEGKTPADLWRRFLWNETTQDWDITNEQAENPYNLGWK